MGAPPEGSEIRPGKFGTATGNDAFPMLVPPSMPSGVDVFIGFWTFRLTPMRAR
jgi:hypothetical protein